MLTLGEQILNGEIVLHIQEADLILDFSVQRSDASGYLLWELTLSKGDEQLHKRSGQSVDDAFFEAPVVESLARLERRFRQVLRNGLQGYAETLQEVGEDVPFNLALLMMDVTGVVYGADWLSLLLPEPREGGLLRWLVEQFSEDGLLSGTFGDSTGPERRFALNFISAELAVGTHPVKATARVIEWVDGTVCNIVEQQISVGPVPSRLWNDPPPQDLDALKSLLSGWRLRLSGTLAGHYEDWMPFPHDFVVFPLRVFEEREVFSPHHPRNNPVQMVRPHHMQVGQWSLFLEEVGALTVLLLQRKDSVRVPILWCKQGESSVYCMDGDTETARRLLEWLVEALDRYATVPAIRSTLLDWSLRLDPLVAWREAVGTLIEARLLSALKDARLYEQFLRSRHRGFRGALESIR